MFGGESILERAEKDGIKHTWSGQVDTSQKANFIWEFDWEDLKNQGANRLVGHLIVTSFYGLWTPKRVNIDWTDTNHSATAKVETGGYSSCQVLFEYKLTVHYAESPAPEKKLFPPKNISYDDMFLASDNTDVILIVEGKKLNVNKTFLSIHSDYFKTLFSSNFKEGQMEEIDIKEVSHEDFGLLLSTIYPMQVFPNGEILIKNRYITSNLSDATAEKLLELADRFLMPSVKHVVEHHLLEHSKMENEKMLWLADEYGMQDLLEKCIGQMISLEKAKILKKSPEFKKLSDNTKASIFEHLLEAV